MRKSQSEKRASSHLSRVRSIAAVAAVTGGLVLAAPTSAFAAGTVTGFVTCYWPNTDGSFTYSVGYTNTAATTVTIPVGPNNYVNPAPNDHGQPTVFLAGTHNNVWAPTVTQADFNYNPNWYVNGVAVSYSGNMPQCPSKPVSVSGSTSGYLGATAAIVAIGAYVLSMPRRRRGLTKAAKAPATVGA